MCGKGILELLDFDGDGELSFAEFQHALRGQRIQEEDLKQFMIIGRGACRPCPQTLAAGSALSLTRERIRFLAIVCGCVVSVVHAEVDRCDSLWLCCQRRTRGS
jgi:hypothetical protein